MTDIPHDRWPQEAAFLLDVRDALHTVTGRRSDHLVLQEQQAVADAGASIQGAKVSTLGADVVDVFFLVDRLGRPLTAEHARAVCQDVGRALV